MWFFFFFSSRRRHTRLQGDWSSDVCSSDLTSPARRFVVATETGVLHRLRRENPDKQFHALAESAECRFMKLITLEKLRDCLRDLKPEVVVPPDVAARARRAIDRMLAIG